jgi:hypothetical protein
LKGKLKSPGKPAIAVEIAPWMKGEMDFTIALPSSASLPTAADSTTTSLPPDAIATSSEVTSEAVSRLEALYSRMEVKVLPLPIQGDQALYEAVKALLEAGKSKTWIIETVLSCRGRKFEQGKALLNELLKRFGE